jgi:hypothetical protein
MRHNNMATYKLDGQELTLEAVLAKLPTAGQEIDKYNFRGKDYTESELVAEIGADLAKLYVKNYQTELKMVKNTAYTEQERAKMQDRRKQYREFFEANGGSLVNYEERPGAQTWEEFVADASAKVQAGKGQRNAR